MRITKKEFETELGEFLYYRDRDEKRKRALQNVKQRRDRLWRLVYERHQSRIK